MRRLLNTLYITSEESYLALDGENVIVKKGDEIAARFPLHTLETIITFAYAGASPALMGACAERGVSLSFCTPRGRFLARTVGESNGNVYLRRKQYRIADKEKESAAIASSMLIGKVYNCRRNIERAIRDHGMRMDTNKLKKVSDSLKESMLKMRKAQSKEELRGLEGDAASSYYSVLTILYCAIRKAFIIRSGAVGRLVIM